MLKICLAVLTLSTGQPTIVNLNEMLAVTQSPQTVFGTEGNKIYFVQGTALGQSSLSIKETVEEVLAKAEKCNEVSPVFSTFRIAR